MDAVRGTLALALLALAPAAGAQKVPDDVGREFTVDEYARINGAFEADGANATAARLLRGYVPLYPISRVLSHVSGVCVMEFDVGVDGTVSRLERAREDDRKMCDHAEIAMRHWRFQPATQDGMPVVRRYRVPITYSFR